MFQDILNHVHSAGASFLPALFTLFWQSSLIFGITILIDWGFRNYSASSRHQLWTLAFLTAPLLPLLNWLVRFIPDFLRPVPSSLPERIITFYLYGDSSQLVPSTTTIASNDQSTAGFFTLEMLPSLLSFGVVLGICVLFAIVVKEWIRVAIMRTESTEIHDSQVTCIFDTAASLIGFKRNYSLREHPLLSTPVACGSVHPFVCLPLFFKDMPPGNGNQMAALHELAHLRRYDPLILTFVSLVKALFMFNPLVWWGARRVRILAEEACDEFVLDKGTDPLQYAKLLENMANSMGNKSMGQFAFAQLPISGRIRRILSFSEKRKGNGKRYIAGAAVVIVMIVSVFLTSESMTTQSFAQTETRDEQTAQDQYHEQEQTTDQADNFRNPIEGDLIAVREFGTVYDSTETGSRVHGGVDLLAELGTVVFAIGDGIVTEAGFFPGMGYYVNVDHGNETESLYANLEQSSLIIGTRVRRGERIGVVGDFEMTEHHHLHFGMRHHGIPVRPFQYLEPPFLVIKGQMSTDDIYQTIQLMDEHGITMEALIDVENLEQILRDQPGVEVR